MKNTKSAFTVLEIMVVIAIIGIIAAIFFPAFQHAKRNQLLEREQAVMDEYLGYPAFPSDLKDGEVYEVVTGWHDTSAPEPRYLTFLRGQSGHDIAGVRLFSLVRKFEPGFYRAFAGTLTPLNATTLEKN